MLRLTGVAPGAVRIEVRAAVGALLAWPSPPPLMGLQASRVASSDLDVFGDAQSDFGGQSACIARVTGDRPSMPLRYSESGSFAPDWAWSPPTGALNRPSPELEALALAVAGDLKVAARLGLPACLSTEICASAPTPKPLKRMDCPRVCAAVLWQPFAAILRRKLPKKFAAIWKH